MEVPMERDEIIIRRAIIHILDSAVGMPVLSDTLLELSEEMNDFLRGHIYKIASGDDCKKCNFDKDQSSIYSILSSFNEEDLVTISQQIADNLYSIMNQNIDIPAADLFVVTYQCNSQIHLAILKMNYKEFYVHYTQNVDAMNIVDIIKQTAALPGMGSRLSEAALINLSDFTMVIVEKKYDINGVKANYFSEMFLKCSTQMSSKTKLAIVTKAVEQVNKKYYEDDFDKQMLAKSLIHNDIIEQGSIVPETIGDKLFGEIPEIKEEFIEKLEKYNLVTQEVTPQNKLTTKKFEKQFLTTDSGIEINIPMEEYNNKENVEFITNPDGSISVLIKNINKITSK